MRVPWSKSKPLQLDLLSPDPAADTDSSLDAVVGVERNQRVVEIIPTGRPLIVSTASLFEDPNNPRTEFPQAELEELAEDIRQHGILQPIVVHPADAVGRYQIHFGAKRWRAAQFAELNEVPVVVREASADPYTQVAENQKRRGLIPLDLARFIRGRVDAGDSNATVAKRLGMNLTTVAHHLALLELPPELGEALKSGRITSPRTLHELSNLHAEQPEQVRTLLSSGAELTRSQVSALRAAAKSGTASDAAMSSANKLVRQANNACDRLERALSRRQPFPPELTALPELIALRIRFEDITKRWLQGSDRQTPSQSNR
jgi:ParB family transcriptional regulator, chromosome partitioning protein